MMKDDDVMIEERARIGGTIVKTTRAMMERSTWHFLGVHCGCQASLAHASINRQANNDETK